MERIYKAIAVTVFLAVLWIVPLSIFFTGDREFSENENRYLQGKPDISPADIANGQFMDDFEAYMDDQFPLRDTWTAFKTDLQRLAGRKDINGVYLGKDGYLLEQWTESEFRENIEILQQNVAGIRNFAQAHNGQKVSVLIVPTAGLILQNKLPEHAPMFDQDQAFDIIFSGLNESLQTGQEIQVADVRKTLEDHKNESIYYKTDHHWTTYGAFLGYAAWAAKNGRSARLSDYTVRLAAKDFKGSLYSKVLNRDVATDEIFLFDEKADDRNESRSDARCVQQSCKVGYNFGRTQAEGVYAMERLSQKDKYQVFLNGNHPEITITTGAANGKHILVFKDSFANAFIPFLLSDYASVHVIDQRYFRGDLADYIRQNKITEYLFLYNVKNFCEGRLVLLFGG